MISNSDVNQINNIIIYLFDMTIKQLGRVSSGFERSSMFKSYLSRIIRLAERKIAGTGGISELIQ